jgi:hypothetical protein
VFLDFEGSYDLLVKEPAVVDGSSKKLSKNLGNLPCLTFFSLKILDYASGNKILIKPICSWKRIAISGEKLVRF